MQSKLKWNLIVNIKKIMKDSGISLKKKTEDFLAQEPPLQTGHAALILEALHLMYEIEYSYTEFNRHDKI